MESLQGLRTARTSARAPTRDRRADRIETPTLFMVGELDWNVPLINSEQMYQALRSLNVPTQLIVYPGEHHGLSKPSYIQDRLDRMIDWYGKYLGVDPEQVSEVN